MAGMPEMQERFPAMARMAGMPERFPALAMDRLKCRNVQLATGSAGS